MPQPAGPSPQVKLSPRNAARLKKIAKKTKRSLTQEANVAVEQYKPKETK